MSSKVVEKCDGVIKLAWKELKDLSFFASKDETRYTLNGVCIELEGYHVRLVATDGRRLAALETGGVDSDPVVSRRSFIVPLDLIDKVKVGVKFPLELYWAKRPEVDYYDLEFKMGSRSIKARSIEGTFPKWREVIQEASPKPTNIFSFNLEFGADFAKAAKLLCPAVGAQAVVRGFGEYGEGGHVSAYLVSLPMRPDFVGVIMPVRMENLPTYPTWCLPEKKQEAVA